MPEMGLYIHNGSGYQLKDSGACFRKTGSGNSECEIFARTGSGWQKIYPRYVSWSLPNGGQGGIGLSTIRSGYGGTNWKVGRAMQGFYTGKEGNSQQSIGHIYWNWGKPSISGLVSIDRVAFSIWRNVNTGWYNRVITGSLRCSNYDTNTIVNRAGSFNGCVGTVQNSPRFDFTWNVGNTLTTIDNNGSLNNFMYQFLTNGGYQSLCLYTGETGGSWYNGGCYSANYAGTTSVSIEIWATVQA